ncbi:MAG: hypothetical protein WC980_09945 [Candidatus Brocadiia bacterium]
MKIYIIIFIVMSLIFVSLPACKTTESNGSIALSKQINQILDKTNTEEFWLKVDRVYTDIDENITNTNILNTKEAEFLIEHKEISFPLIFERFNQLEASGKIEESRENRLYDIILSLYFLIFKETKSIESIPYLSRYLSRIDYKLYSSIKPLSVDIAEDAAKAITDGQVVGVGVSTKDTATELQKWYEEYKKKTQPK